jgi:omega-6 fatty acid desaturase (delta-12 desaturase)
MAMPREDDRRYLDARLLNLDRLLILAVITGAAIFYGLVAPRWSTLAGGPPMSGQALVTMLVVVPWVIFHGFFGVVTFLHHTHPRVPWLRTKRESSFFAGQVRATVHVTLPLWLERALHNINVHGAHHVDPRVPFLQLPDAQRRIEHAFGDHVIVERWSLGYLIAVTRTCKVYDYDRHRWHTFTSALDPRPTTGTRA